MTAKEWFRANLLTMFMLVSIFVGLLLGFSLNFVPTPLTKRQIMYVGYIGDIFLRMLNCLVIPMVFFSLINAIGNLEMSLSRKIGWMAVTYYFGCASVACTLGMTLAIIIKPGSYGEPPPTNFELAPTTPLDAILDLVRNLFPQNPIGAAITMEQTVLIENDTITDIYLWDFELVEVSRSNIMGIIVLSIVIGSAIVSIKPPSLLILFQETSIVVMKITFWIIWFAPIGVLFLVASRLIGEGIAKFLGSLGIYCAICVFGALFHGFCFQPLVYFLFTRKNPYVFIKNQSPAIIMAFATASSAATLPLNISCLENKNHVDSRVVRFILPIGATINMNGTALYEAVAALYISQVRRRSLNIGNIIAIGITAVLASVGTAGIPNGGLVTMLMVLGAINLPKEDVGLILPVDWVIDHCVTAVNILGDAFGAAIIAHVTRNTMVSPVERTT